jgi:hypothetical protein
VSLQLALLVVAIGGYGAWRRPTLFDPSQDASRVICSGNIEAHESVLSVTQVRAPIVYLPFDEGAYVKRDTVLPRWSTARIVSRRRSTVATWTLLPRRSAQTVTR